MIRIAFAGLLLAACSTQTEEAAVNTVAADGVGAKAADAAPVAKVAASDHHDRKPSSAPVEFEGDIGSTTSTIKVAFTAPGDDLSVEIWGATGLQTDNKVKTVWSGDLDEPTTMTFTVNHNTDGNLAVRASGIFGEAKQNRVVSFTVGNPPQVDVPTTTIDGVRVQGWQGTTR